MILNSPKTTPKENKSADNGLTSTADVPVLLGSAVGGVISFDQHGLIKGLNPSAERLFNYAAAELIGQEIDRLIPSLQLDDTLITERVQKLSAYQKDGHSFIIELRLSQIHISGQPYWIGIIRNASETTPADQCIHDLARFPDENPSPVMRINAKGKILYFNKPSQELIDDWQTSLNALAPKWLIYLAKETLDNGTPQEQELDFREKTLVLVLTPILTENYVNIYIRDITKRKKAEEDLRKHHKFLEVKVKERTADLAVARDEALTASRTKSAFLANMSHELRTPLNAIIGYSELLIDDDPGFSSTHKKDLGHIRQAGKHLLGLINGILDLSKIEAGGIALNLKQIDVPTLINEVEATVLPLMSANNNEFVVDCPAVGEIQGDATRLKQVLYNLLGNAAKFTHDGQVTLAVKHDINTHDGLKISIKDTGIGLTKHQLKTVFDPFTQADESLSSNFGGTGLGLSIAQELCRMMGGDISAASQPGKGSEFVIQIPNNGAN